MAQEEIFRLQFPQHFHFIGQKIGVISDPAFSGPGIDCVAQKRVPLLHLHPDTALCVAGRDFNEAHPLLRGAAALDHLTGAGIPKGMPALVQVRPGDLVPIGHMVPVEMGEYPIGHPVKGAEIRILDQNGAEVPAGETGEICIYGGGVSLGYIGDHAEENKAFAVLSDGSAMYRSGDLGYLLPNGDIAFLHRKDTQIMIYGKRVEVAEVESRLYQCKNVQQAVVRAFTDEDGLSYMTAYVVPANQDMRVSAVRKELLENLTSFMIPEFIVKMPQIPLNTNGKPDVSRLPVVMKAGNF